MRNPLFLFSFKLRLIAPLLNFRLSFLAVFLALVVTQGCAQNTSTPELLEFSYSECDDETDYNDYESHLIERRRKGNKTEFIIGVVSDCCPGFEGNMKYNNRTLHLDFTKTGEVCDCYCVYEMRFVIEGLPKGESKLFLGKKELVMPKD